MAMRSTFPSTPSPTTGTSAARPTGSTSASTPIGVRCSTSSTACRPPCSSEPKGSSSYGCSRRALRSACSRRSSRPSVSTPRRTSGPSRPCCRAGADRARLRLPIPLPEATIGPAMRPTPFYGWTVLAAAFAIITLSIGTLFTLGVFLKPIEEGMGWSRSSIGAVSLLNWFVMGLGGVVAGYLSDRFGTRAVVLSGGVLLGLGLVLSGQVREVWQLYVTFGILVGAGVSTFYVPLTVLAVKWFDDRRGMAAAIVSAGNGLGILALSPLSRWLINQFEWRTAFVILGDLAWLVVIPCAILLRPAPAPLRAQGRPAAGPS